VIFHFDRGAQYTSITFDTYAKKNNIRPWPTLRDLTTETADWIENYFNTKRRHSTLEYLTPREYEPGYRHISQLAA
ncbi:integrase core domain-containing protein, partial [Frankia sp. Cas3]|uniref:integrase core domain-containing protein n=1 Tax=Frankia sp. Cas3 TaxID=3073926 RepID=UPI002AD32E32